MKISEAKRVGALLLEHRERRSNPQIATEAGEGVTVRYVDSRRKALGIPPYRGRGWETRGAVDWSEVDWALSNTELAERYGVRADTISELRRELAPETSRVRDRDWSEVDWSQGNAELAKTLGCHPGHVSRMRARHAPETRGKSGGSRV